MSGIMTRYSSNAPAIELAEPAPRVKELLSGLLSTPKRISSKFFYDDEGSRLFSRIIETEDYYPARCEEEILREKCGEILRALEVGAGSLQVIELGPGDGRKTLPLLREACLQFKHVHYRPVDISSAALQEACQRIAPELPSVQLEPSELDFESGLESLPLSGDRTHLVLYLGSSIGNYRPPEQHAFFSRLRSCLRPGDFVLSGFDLRKDHRVLERAYDDSEGVTREFNLNLLKRVNRELSSDIDLSAFVHHASYNPRTGAMESWVISQKDQRIRVGAPGAEDRVIRLEAFEGIHVETSWKFSLQEIGKLALSSGFTPIRTFLDSRSWFADDLWRLEPKKLNQRLRPLSDGG